MRIIVTGTPGTGKTTISKKLAEKLGFLYMNLNELIVGSSNVSWDPCSHTFDVIDPEKSRELLRNAMISISNCVCETLAIDLLEPTMVDKIIVLRRNPYALLNTLGERNWPPKKVAENVMAELLNILAYEAQSSFHNVIEIDTTDKTIDDCVSLIMSAINERNSSREGIDWLSALDGEDLLDFIQSLERDSSCIPS